MFSDALNDSRIYTPAEILDFLRDATSVECRTRSKKHVEYADIPMSFDIETTSVYVQQGRHKVKNAFMYAWSAGINGLVMFGRTWEEAGQLYRAAIDFFRTGSDRRIVVYVHNLGYEFQFIRKRIKWAEVFSMDERRPVRAITADGVEFRCSLYLSGLTLETIGEKSLQTYCVKKMVGDLDYSLIRHSGTPMTEKEIGYCVNDVKVVMAYVRERMDEDDGITKIPMTKTGYVRDEFRRNCLYGGGGDHRKSAKNYFYYSALMRDLTLTVDEYRQLKRAFAGGFTHADANVTGKTIRDVASYDFTSSYPAVMLTEAFPMSKAEIIPHVTREIFEDSIKHYCCLFDVEFIDIEATVNWEHPISRSKCWQISGDLVDNGRVVSANSLRMTITEQDYKIFEKFYHWRAMRIASFRRYRRGYLPDEFIATLLDLYGKKTTLKGVDGMEIVYQKSKEMLNSAYGMCVTDIIRPRVCYDRENWTVTETDPEEAIEKYNRDPRRFLSYPWGVWVTSYARRNLFTAIYCVGPDYCYSDTDSVKIQNAEQHAEYFAMYDASVRRKIDRAMKWHRMPVELASPKTIKGEEKTIGVWDYEGVYSRFRTLGAKRYLTEQDGKISLTCAGVSKERGAAYLKTLPDPFVAFRDGLYIPPECTGKNTHTYLDDPQEGDIVDYLGNVGHYSELSSVHLEAAEYRLSLSQEYLDFLLSIQEEDF